MSHTTGPFVDGNPIEIGFVPNNGARLPGGSTCGLALHVWIATRSCRTMVSTYHAFRPL